MARRVSFLVTASNKGFMKALDQSADRMDKFGRKMQRTGRKFSTYITLPATAAGGAAIKMASDFEASLSKIEGLVGVARSEVQGMRGDVLALAGETARSPQELADALFFVTSAGLRGADAINVLEASARAASAGLGETKDIADLVTSAVNAYGIENLSAAQATDTLVAAVREGKAEADQLAQSMGQVLPIASNLGVGFDQVGAAIAAMTRTGTDAATASTQLRQILASLLKPSAGAENAMKQMGTSSADLRKTLREDGLVSVLGFLREQMNENEQAMAQVFPNIRALSGALDIMGANAQENIGIFNRMRDSTGSLDAAFEAAAQTTNFKFDQALSSLKANAIEMGEVLLPIVNKVLSAVTNLSRRFSGLSDENKQQIVLWGGLAAAIGPAMIAMGTVIRLASSAISPFKGLNKVIGSLGRGLFALLSPLGLKIALLGGLVLVAKSVWDTFKPLRDFFTNLWNGIAKVFQSAINFIIRSWNKVSEVVASVVPGIAATAVKAISWMDEQTRGKLGEFAGNVKSNFDSAFGSVTGFVRGSVNGVNEWIQSLFRAEQESRNTADATDSFSASIQRAQIAITGYKDRLDGLSESIIANSKVASSGMKDAGKSVDNLGNRFTFLEATAGQVFDRLTFGAEKLSSVLTSVLRQLASRALMTGLKMLTGVGGISSFGGFFASVIGVNDALIKSDGSVVQFHPDDNILAMKDFGNLTTGGGRMNLSGEFRVRGTDLVLTLDRAQQTFDR